MLFYMNVYMDLEFTGLHKNTEIISIGLVSECGKTFYAEFNDYNVHKADKRDKQWLKDNVISKLLFNDRDEIIPKQPVTICPDYSMLGDTRQVRGKLREWLNSFEDKVTIVSDCLAYDWVLFNHIFGHAFNIPDNVFYIPIDICTMFVDRGIDPDISRLEYAGITSDSGHNSLFDAQVIKKCYDRLISEYSIFSNNVLASLSDVDNLIKDAHKAGMYNSNNLEGDK